MRGRAIVVGLALALAPFSAAAHLPAFDANDDGRITLAEYQDGWRRILMRADIDGDGRITEREWLTAAGKLQRWLRKTDRPDWVAMGNGRLFAALDLNGDHVVTRAEIDTVTRRRFARFDTNHDGVVTQAEARKMWQRATAP